MTSTLADPLLELDRLWRRVLRDLLHYLAESSDPILVDEDDQAAQKSIQQFHAAGRALDAEIVRYLVSMGRNPMAPAFALEYATFNYLRPTNLLPMVVARLRRDLESAQAVLAKLGEDDGLAARRTRGFVEELVALREPQVEEGQRLLTSLTAKAASRDGDTEVAVVDAPVAVDGEAPWHDESLAMEQRMKLAEGRGLFEKLFAAMAQTDCTACGYDCEGYARALADGEDKDLSKCAPGELETQQMLERLMKQVGRV